MVLFLNYLHWIIIIGCGFIVGVYMHKGYYRRVGLVVLLMAVSLFLIQSLSAGYIPKRRASSVAIPNPTFEEKNLEIENRLHSPTHTREESEKRFEDKVNWRKVSAEKSNET